MEEQIKALADKMGITGDLQVAYQNGNFAGSFKQKVDQMMSQSSVEFCPYYEFLRG